MAGSGGINLVSFSQETLEVVGTMITDTLIYQ